MSLIPPEIDDAMWRLAETGTVAERANFVAEHSQYCDEMQRRIQLLSRFKGSRQSSTPKSRFVPSQSVSPVPGVPTWALAGMACVLISSLAFAGYGVYRFAHGSEVAAGTQVGIAPNSNHNPAVGPSEPSHKDAGSVAPPDQNSGQKSSATAQTPPPPAAPKSAWDTPVSVVSKQTSLSNAFLAIAAQAHVKIELAPGMMNPDIEISYKNQKAKAVLDDLGHQLGFSVIIQSEKAALLIPAVDPNRTAPASVGEVNKTPSVPNNIEFKKADPGLPDGKNSGTLPPAPQSGKNPEKSGQ